MWVLSPEDKHCRYCLVMFMTCCGETLRLCDVDCCLIFLSLSPPPPEKETTSWESHEYHLSLSSSQNEKPWPRIYFKGTQTPVLQYLMECHKWWCAGWTKFNPGNVCGIIYPGPLYVSILVMITTDLSDTLTINGVQQCAVPIPTVDSWSLHLFITIITLFGFRKLINTPELDERREGSSCDLFQTDQ